MIVRIAQFFPKAGQQDSVMQTLRAHLAFTASFGGCRRAYLGTPIHGQHILVYSEWGDASDVERFEAALRMDPHASGDFFGVLAHLAAPPLLARFEVAE